MRSSKRDWASRSLVSRASGARASSARAERDPGPSARRAKRNIGTRYASIFSWVPALAPATPSLRPRHEREHSETLRPPTSIHLSNSPSQLKPTLRSSAESPRAAPRFSLSLLPERGAERREGANLSRLRSATNHACEAWCASCGTRPPLGAPPWRFPARGRSSWLRRRRPLRLNAASHSRPGRSARRAGPRRLPSLRVRAAAAGATPRSASRSPLDGARHRAGIGIL